LHIVQVSLQRFHFHPICILSKFRCLVLLSSRLHIV
jgi:hypothetical protein